MCWIISSILFFNFIYLFNLEREEGRERSICCSTYLCILWLILICALTGGQTCKLGISGQHSNQLSNPTRAYQFLHLFTEQIYLRSLLCVPHGACCYRQNRGVPASVFMKLHLDPPLLKLSINLPLFSWTFIHKRLW